MSKDAEFESLARAAAELNAEDMGHETRDAFEARISILTPEAKRNERKRREIFIAQMTSAANHDAMLEEANEIAAFQAEMMADKGDSNDAIDRHAAGLSHDKNGARIDI